MCYYFRPISLQNNVVILGQYLARQIKLFHGERGMVAILLISITDVGSVQQADWFSCKLHAGFCNLAIGQLLNVEH